MNFLIASVIPVLRTINKNSPHQDTTSWYFRRLEQREGEKGGERKRERGPIQKKKKKGNGFLNSHTGNRRQVDNALTISGKSLI